MDNNVTFYVYNKTIQHNIENTLCIQMQTMKAYKRIVQFKAWINHMYIQAKRDTGRNGC